MMAVLMFLLSAIASPAPSSTAGTDLVAPAVLEKLLPSPEGWTRGVVRAMQTEITQECSYSSASISFTKDEMKVKLTLADTGAHQESLLALAMMVMTLPDNYTDDVPPATTVKRLKMDGSPAAELWDAQKLSGEITVVVGGRFVASVETAKVDSLDTLRAILASVNLKALAAAK